MKTNTLDMQVFMVLVEIIFTQNYNCIRIVLELELYYVRIIIIIVFNTFKIFNIFNIY